MAGKPRLTPKQLHFARCIANGMSQSDAYREAFDVREDTPNKTIWSSASKVASRPLVKERIQYLIGMKEAAIAQSAVSLRAKVLEKLEHFMEHAQPQDSQKIRSAELLGKSIGLFKEIIEDSRSLDMTSDQLTEMIRQKLEAFQEETHH